MGVLDDAIREHLDLKRQHGAAEDEVVRQEAEALGPARREAPAAVFGEPAESEGHGPGEPITIEPVADVAPPPAHQTDVAATPVHDIDEDPLAPPPPVAGAPIDGAPTEPAPIERPPERSTGDRDSTVEYDTLRDDRE